MAKRKKAIAITVIVTVLFSLTAFAWHILAQPKTVSWGSRGEDVRVLQTKLRDWGYLKGSVDGIYGSATYAAVKSFQQKNGLKADGIVGPNTWAALGISTAARTNDYTPSRAVSNRDDVTLLARAVHAEAGAEPYEGKVAVGAVILNRVKSASFPNSLAGVIYQPLAFESVANGIINRPPSQDSIRAAQDALNGWDPTYGSLYFWNPSKPVNKWIWSRKVIVRIGQHVFGL